MMWLEGYYTEEDEPATIDFGKMAGHLAKILIDCEANPDKTRAGGLRGRHGRRGRWLSGYVSAALAFFAAAT